MTVCLRCEARAARSANAGSGLARLALLLVLSGFGASAAQATTILDLDAFPAGSQVPDGAVVAFADGSGGTATIDNFLDRQITFTDSNFIDGRVFCLHQQFGCGMSGAMYFSTAIADLTLRVEQTSTFSNVRVRAFNGGGLVGELRWNDIDPALTNFGRTRLYDFSSVGAIDALEFNSLGDIAFYGDFRFIVPAAQVPAPAGAALLLMGLALSAGRSARPRD